MLRMIMVALFVALACGGEDPLPDSSCRPCGNQRCPAGESCEAVTGISSSGAFIFTDVCLTTECDEREGTTECIVREPFTEIECGE